MHSRRPGFLEFVLALTILWQADLAVSEDTGQAARRAQLLAPFFANDTFAVVRVDFERLDVRWLYGLARKVPDLLNVLPLVPKQEGAVRVVNDFRAAGGKELYVLLSTGDLEEPRPFVLAPLAPGADAAVIGALLRDSEFLRLTDFETTEQFGDVMFAGSRQGASRLKSVKPSPRPQLTTAMKAGADSAVQLIIVPTDDNRRVFEQWMLPALAGDAQARPLIRETAWAAIGLSGPPQARLKVVVGTRDAQTAERIESAIGALIVSQGRREEVREIWPRFEELAKFVIWKHDASSVSTLLDDRQGQLSAFAEMAALRPLIPAVAREARWATMVHMKQLGIALGNHHDTQKSFPSAAITSKEGEPLLSWRVALLPYFEEVELNDLHKQFHLDEPWDSPHNTALVVKMPIIYRCPKSRVAESGRTVYLAPRGNATVFPGVGKVRYRDITDGSSNTIAFVEVDDDHAVPWTKPEDWNFDPANPTKGLGGHFPGGFVTGVCDGSAHFLSNTIRKETLRALLTRNGNDVVSWPDD